MEYGIVDSHVHVGTGGVPVGPRDPAASFSLWRARATTAGIRAAVLMAAPVGTYATANQTVAKLTRRTPGVWFWYVFINPVTDRGRVGELVASAHSRGASGIKVHWSDGAATDEVARAATRYRMPVLFDPGGDTGRVRHLAQRHPCVPWIVPHLSSFSDQWPAQKAFIDLLVRLPNVFTDTSGVRYFDLLAEAVARAGAHKVLYGSDGPYLHPAPEIAKIRALLLPPDGQRLVLRGNILRLIRPTNDLPRRNDALSTAHPHLRSPICS